MGGVFPLTCGSPPARSSRWAGTSARPTRSTRWAPSSARSCRASWCCRRSACRRGSTSRCAGALAWRRCCSPWRPGCRAAADGPASPPPWRWRWHRRPRPAPLGPGQLLRRASSASRSRGSTSRAGPQAGSWQNPKLVFYEDGIATTVSRRPVGQDLLAQEQRQGRRLQRRRHADPDHRGAAAAAVLPTRPDRRRRWPWSASARASPPAPSPSSPSPRWRWSSSSRPIYRASHFFDHDNHRPLREPQGHRARRRRAKLPHPAQRQVRRHRQRALEPLDHRACPTCSRASTSRASRRAWPRRHLLPVGAALRDGALEHQDHLRARCARSSPTSTCSPPRICRRTPS